jgi:hypothetical protein
VFDGDFSPTRKVGFPALAGHKVRILDIQREIAAGKPTPETLLATSTRTRKPVPVVIMAGRKFFEFTAGFGPRLQLGFRHQRHWSLVPPILRWSEGGFFDEAHWGRRF